MNKKFECIITICILANTIIMAMKYYMMSDKFSMILEFINYAFVVIFNIECLFKLMGLGKNYFSNLWNFFDFLVVIGTDVGLLIGIIDTTSNISTAATVVRGFRIMRIFRLIRSSKHIRIIIDTLMHILP